MSEEAADGYRGAVRSLVQWKDKPDHVFSACDDGTVKVRRGAGSGGRGSEMKRFVSLTPTRSSLK